MITLKAEALEGCGPGIVHIAGSFTTLSNGTPTGIRPTRGNYTLTRKAAGVYVFQYTQAALSVVNASCSLGPAAVEGSAGISVESQPAGFCMITQDFMTTNAGGTAYAVDTTNKQLVITVFNQPTGGATTDIYALGNSGGVAKYRLSFDIELATSALNK